MQTQIPEIDQIVVITPDGDAERVFMAFKYKSVEQMLYAFKRYTERLRARKYNVYKVLFVWDDDYQVFDHVENIYQNNPIMSKVFELVFIAILQIVLASIIVMGVYFHVNIVAILFVAGFFVLLRLGGRYHLQEHKSNLNDELAYRGAQKGFRHRIVIGLIKILKWGL